MNIKKKQNAREKDLQFEIHGWKDVNWCYLFYRTDIRTLLLDFHALQCIGSKSITCLYYKNCLSMYSYFKFEPNKIFCIVFMQLNVWESHIASLPNDVLILISVTEKIVIEVVTGITYPYKQ